MEKYIGEAHTNKNINSEQIIEIIKADEILNNLKRSLL